MSTPKKIAVLVHNDVLRDARVRKQARTLVEAGHDVDVFGFSSVDNEYPSHVEGARLKIETARMQSPAMNFGLKVRKGLKGNLPGPVGRVFKTLRSIARGKLAAKMTALLLLFTMMNTLLLALVFLALAAPAVLFAISGVLKVLLVIVLICIAAVIVLKLAMKFFLGQYIEDWIKVNWGYGSIARSLARNVIGQGYDVVHCHDMIAMIAGEMIKKDEPGITMVWDAHELYTELSYKTPYMSKFTGMLIARISRHVDKMITISQSFIDFYAKHYPKLPPAEMVMNATRRPVTEDMNRSLLRDAAGVNDAQKILLFQGGVAPFRGVEILLDAAPRLPANWSVVFMGYGPLQDQIMRAAETANADRPEGAPCIAFIPPAPQEVLRDWTSGADLGIIPYENTSKNHLYCTPNKLWEYPNARVPILATDLVEIEQIITANGTGTLLPRAFTASDIVSAIEAVTDAQLEEWRANCDVFNETENWEKFEPNLLKVYA